MSVRARMPNLDARLVAAAALTLALIVLTVGVLGLFRGFEQPPLSAEQLAALSRLEPYREALEQDFDATLSSLPSEFSKSITLSPDELSALGVVGLMLSDGTCAALRVDIGPGWLLEGDREALSVSQPLLLPESDCTASS